MCLVTQCPENYTCLFLFEQFANQWASVISWGSGFHTLKGSYQLQNICVSIRAISRNSPCCSYTHRIIWRNFQSAFVSSSHSQLQNIDRLQKVFKASLIYLLFDNTMLQSVPLRELQSLKPKLHLTPAGPLVEAPALMPKAEKIMWTLNSYLFMQKGVLQAWLEVHQ